MKLDINSDPTKFICSKGEIITVTFAPNSSDALGVINYCFKPICKKIDQRQVVGNQISFPILDIKFPLQLFFFFKSGTPLGKCEILLNSSNGDTYREPHPVEEEATGLLTKQIYIFEIG